jgi:hypothetical protein
MHIPGTSVFTEKRTIPERLLLLTGPIGAGKTIYCKQFFEDGIFDRDYCIYISSSFTNRQFRSQLCNIENLNLLQNSKFINPSIYNIAQDKQQIDPSISPLVYDNKTSSAVGITRGIDGLSLYLESLIFVAKMGVGTSVAIAITNTDITAKQECVSSSDVV